MIKVFQDRKYTVEPANVHCISYVKSLNIANMERTTADSPAGCEDTDIPNTYVSSKVPAFGDYFMYNGKYVYPSARNITGNTVLYPGFNCGITKIANNNELQIVAMLGSGASMYEQQTELKLYDSETKPTNSNLYAGGIKCTETIKAINGIEQKTIPLIPGPGITVELVDENTISINVNENQLSGKCEDGCGNMN